MALYAFLLSHNFNLRYFCSAWTPTNTHSSSGKFLSTKTCYPESFFVFSASGGPPYLKTGLHIIYQEEYVNFINALRLANMTFLTIRRLEAIARFSKKAFTSDKHRHCFLKSDASSTILRWRPTAALKPVTCRTQRYERMSLPLMTRLLAWHPLLKYTAPDLA